MDVALWAYPWDIIDEGVKAVTDRLHSMGVSELTMATNYHAVQAFLPHNPRRRTYFARSSAYFQPENDYGTLSPIPNETMGEADWTADITSAIESTPLSLNSWTVGCHNSRLGFEHPDLTLETPHGDSLVFGLCPSNPAVQEYLITMLTELDERFDFERIELETFDFFYGTGFRWHHEKYHTRLGRVGEFLFGLCFCDACRENAQESGIDVAAARQTCRDTVDAIANGNMSHEQHLGEWLADHSAVREYAFARTETLTDLFAELSQVVDADIGYYVGLFDPARSWMHGADLAALAEHVDHYTVVAYESTREDVVQAIETVAGETANFDVDLHAGVLPGHPAIHEKETVEAVVDGIADQGIDHVSFYNYGLLPEENLEWVARAIDPYV